MQNQRDAVRKRRKSALPKQDDGKSVLTTIWARGVKRAFDLALGLVGLVLVSPVLLAAALLVKISSPGPVFFMQVRTGRGGVAFRPFKFRTMTGGRTPDPHEIVTADHPGVTPVGRALRRLKIDELPQVLNVLRGDMSLVGPRPTLPVQTDAYDDFQKRRLEVRPGLTGLAQVNGNTSISWDERIRYDVYYVQHHGFLMDMGILLKTVLVILCGETRYAQPFAKSRYGPEQRP